MSKNHQFIHLLSLVALIASLFSPLLTLPVTAEDLPLEPEVTLEESDDGTPLDEVEDDIPAAPAMIPVAPLQAIIADAVCGDSAIYAQTASAPVSEGISYALSAPDVDGNFIITATLIDSSIYAWSEAGLDGWIVDGNSATQFGTLTLCPVSEPVEGEPIENDIPQPVEGELIDTDIPEPVEGELIDTDVMGPEGEVGDDPEPEEADEPGEPNIGRGPARETTMARGMDKQATSTGMSISITSDKTHEIMAGDHVTYTITVSNNTGMGQHYTLQHVLPQGFLFDSSTEPYPQMGDYCGVEAGTITCGLADGMVLYSGWSDVWTITVVVDTAYGQYCTTGITNIVTGNWTDNNEASLTTYFSQLACGTYVSISMTPDTQTIDRFDREISLTVTLKNIATDAYGSEVDIPLPEWLRLDGWTATVSGGEGACTYAAPAESLNCADLTVPAQVGGTPGLQEITWTLPAQAEYPAGACGDHTLTAAFTRGSASAFNQANVTISCEPLLTLSQTVSPLVSSTGVEYQFAITVTNIGSETEDSYLLVVETPDGSIVPGVPADFDENQDSCRTATSTEVPFSLECRGRDLPPGQSQTFGYSLTLPENHFPADQCETLSTFVRGLPNGFGAWDETAFAGVTTTFDANCGMTSVSITMPPSVELGQRFIHSLSAQDSGGVPSYADYSFVVELPHGFVVEDPDLFQQICSESSFENPVILRCSSDGGTLEIAFWVIADPEQGAVCGEATSTITGVDGRWHPEGQTDTATTTVVGEECENQFLVEQTASVDVAIPGTYIDYTFKLTNMGTNSNYINIDSIIPIGSYVHSWLIQPAGTDCLALPGWDTADCINVFMNPGETVELVLRTNVDGSATSEMCRNHLTNRLELRVLGESEPREYFLTTPLNCQELSIAKTSSADTLEIGEPFTYTVTVENNGLNDTGGGYAFTDPLPSGIQLVDDGSITLPAEDGITCVPSRSQGVTIINCESENGPPPEGGTHEYTFTVQANYDLDNDVCGNLTNIVTGTSGQWVADAASDWVSTHIECSPLNLTKSVDKATANPGDILTYTITVENTGVATSGQYLFFDDLPPGALLTFDPSPVPHAGANCITHQQGSDVFDCLHSGVTPDEPHVYTFSVKISDEPTPEMCEDGIINWAWGSALGSWSEELPAEGVSAITELNCGPVVTVDANVDVFPPESDEPRQSSVAEPGDTVMYTGTVRNDGWGTAEDVSLEFIGHYQLADWWTPGGDFDTEWCTLDTDPAYAGLILTCEGIELAAGEEFAVTLTSPPVTATDPSCANYQMGTGLTGNYTGFASSSFQVECNADLGITKTASTDLDPEHGTEVAPGGEIKYSIAVTNTGNQNLFPVYFQDRLPQGAILKGLTDPGERCGEMLESGVVIGIECVLDRWVAPGSTHSIGVTVIIPFETGTEMCGDTIGIPASITGYRTRPENPLISFERDSKVVETTIVCEPDVTITKEVNDGSGGEGAFILDDQIEFTITVTNSGTYLANDLTITDNLSDAGIADLTWSDDSDDCEITDGVLECDIGELPAYSGTFSVNISAAIEVNSPVCGDYVNTAILGGDDSAFARQTEAVASFDIDCGPVFSVDKASSYTDVDENEELSLGDEITYSINITNGGNMALGGLTLEDIFDGENELTWTAPDDFDGVNIPVIDIESSIVLQATYVVSQADVDAGAIENCARVTYISDDGAHSEIGCVSDLIPQHPGIALEKSGEIDSGGDERVDAGDSITYTVTVINTGNITLNDVLVVDPLPGLEWKDDPIAAKLAPGTTITFSASWEITQDAIDEGSVTNIALVTANQDAGSDTTATTKAIDMTQMVSFAQVVNVTAVSDQDTVVIDLPQEPAVALEIKGSVASGNLIRYEVIVTNTGNITLTNLVLTSLLPDLEWDSETIITSLAPGESVTLIATYAVTEADIDAGMVKNCAEVGTNELDAATEDCVDIVLEPRPAATAPVVTDLPSTGHGGIVSAASMLWAAAMLSTVMLGTVAVGVRGKR